MAQQVAMLSYTATPLANTSAPSVAKPPADDHVDYDHAHGHHDDDPGDAERPWWSTGKAKLVWLLGGLALDAYALSLVLPERLTYPLFLAATLVALLPFGRRAFALARAGSPFSIETLMVTAAVGTTVIGAADGCVTEFWVLPHSACRSNSQRRRRTVDLPQEATNSSRNSPRRWESMHWQPGSPVKSCS